jgi:hypothetical protein
MATTRQIAFAATLAGCLAAGTAPALASTVLFNASGQTGYQDGC